MTTAKGGGFLSFNKAANVMKKEFLVADIKGADELIKSLNKMADKKTINKVILRAAKRAAASGVTATKEEISSQTTLKKSSLGDGVKTYYSKEVAGVRISGYQLSLSEFKIHPSKPIKKPVQVEIYKGEKKTLKTDPSPFVQLKPSNGNLGVFKRKSDASYPISELRGPSAAGIFRANEDIHENVIERIHETFEKRLLHELDWAMKE